MRIFVVPHYPRKNGKETPLVAPVIDIHIHIQPREMMRREAEEVMRRGRGDLEEILKYSESPVEFLKHMDRAGIERAGLINYVSPEVMGLTPEINDWTARYCSADPRRLLAFGSVHPRFVADAAAEVERLKSLGIRGLKVHPAHQHVAPNEYRQGLGPMRAMYERAQELETPVMIHTGTSIFHGARNVYAQPIFADDVGVDFPDLVVILAHGGRPLWMEEAFFLVRRHKNMYMDISGIPPRKLLEYFPRLEEIAGKVLFGTDWPSPGVADIRGNIEAFRALPLSADAQQKILYGNAARLFPV